MGAEHISDEELGRQQLKRYKWVDEDEPYVWERRHAADDAFGAPLACEDAPVTESKVTQQ